MVQDSFLCPNLERKHTKTNNNDCTYNMNRVIRHVCSYNDNIFCQFDQNYSNQRLKLPL